MGLFDKILPKEDGPEEMIAICSTCGYSADESAFDFELDYESWKGAPHMYKVLFCPKCPDGGCVDDFIYPNK